MCASCDPFAFARKEDREAATVKSATSDGKDIAPLWVQNQVIDDSNRLICLSHVELWSRVLQLQEPPGVLVTGSPLIAPRLQSVEGK